MKFRTDKTDGNTPRNILEEIIWWVACTVARSICNAQAAATSQC